jgi:hypothetical protein
MEMSIRGIGLVLAVLAAAACSGSSGRAPYLTQPAEPCPAVEALAPQRSADPLPADFEPVSAVRCGFTFVVVQPGASRSPGLGWRAAYRSTGPFDDLVRALRLPPQERRGSAACPAVHVPPRLLALTDEAGTTVLPALPGTVCHQPLPEVDAALDALSWVEIAHRE